MSHRFALRDHTQADHARLDARAGALDLSRDDDYKRFMGWQARLVPALEAHLDASGMEEVLPDWPRRRRSEALMADLDALGITPPQAVSVRLPDGRAALWGIAYVLEGSRVGGAMLERSVSDNWRGRATRFLTHGHKDRLWPRFTAALDAAQFEENELAEAIASARDVFALFEAEAPALASLQPDSAAAR